MRRRLMHHTAGDEGGWAMILVIGFMLIASALATVALANSTTQLGASRRDQDYTSALQAARAGVDDFLSHLNSDGNYAYEHSDPTDATTYNVDPTNAALVQSGDPNDWTTVPRATGADAGQYHYSITSPLGGVLTVRSVGRAGFSNKAVTRTLDVTLARDSFLKNLYMTNYEVLDPYALKASPSNDCRQYGYGTDPTSSSTSGHNGACTLIQFGSQDTLTGPVYSNDEIRIQGTPTFQSTFTTAWQKSPYYVDAGSAAPKFVVPAVTGSQQFPTTNAGLRANAVSSGCVYVGPTSVVFNYSAGAGTVTVISPGTTAPATGCSDSTAAMGATPHTFPVPTGKVMWVDPMPAGTTCTVAASAAVIGYPVAGDNSFSMSGSRLAPSCMDGDIYVQGWLKGAVTLGTAQNIFVTNSLRYVGLNGAAYGTPISNHAADVQGSDVLGLSASGFVAVYHPLNCSSFDGDGNCSAGSNVTTAPYPMTNIEIDAAIVSNNDSFIVPNWSLGGGLGKLTVVGAIVQVYRGPVATTSGLTVVGGYGKDYNYDGRFLTVQPPYLASLTSQKWGVVHFSEVKNGS